jgi:ATP-dependent Lon protease
MLDLQQIKKEYSEPLQGYERAIIREYLQYKILQAIFESKQASKLSFLGGTALRIVHGNSRFSEDIDLDNFGLSWQAFAGRLFSSIILWGPPGYGKTTLAMVIANLTKSHFDTLLAVLAGKAELKEVLEVATQRCKLYPKKGILFVKNVLQTHN